MAISVDLYGTIRVIPQTKERNWGAQVTSVLVDLCLGAGAASFLVGQNGFPRITSTDASVAGGATFQPTHAWTRLQSTGGLVTLDTTTPIQAGASDGQIIVIEGVLDANAVTIENQGNVNLNGRVLLDKDQRIALVWDQAATLWKELYRVR